MVRNVDVGRRSSFEHNKAPGDVVVTEQSIEIAPKVLRRPLCQRPAWPKYKAGDVKDAKSFECVM